MKTLILALLLFPLLGLSCGSSKQSQTPAATTASSPDSEMSATFREQAYRAVDSIDRLPHVPARGSNEPWSEELERDAEEAVDEAKYKAQTAKDKEILKILQAALFGRSYPRHLWATDPEWKRLTDLGRQCLIELRVEFEPEKWGEAAVNAAKKKTCLAQLAKQHAIPSR